MGLIDKIKGLFYDEEVIEVPKENLNHDIKINNNVEVMKEETNSIDNVISERDLVKKETNFKFPVIFEDEDFVEPKKEEKKKEEPKYSRYNEHHTKYKKPTLDREVIKEVIEKPKKFTPSPVISPVYGVLDKNYKKEEIERKQKEELEQTNELVVNFDTIRQKAYGTLVDDIENEMDSKTDKIDQIEKEIDDILVENNLLTDLEEDVVEEVKDVEVEDDSEYSYSDFGVEYKISEDTQEDVVEPETEEPTIEEEKIEEIDEVKEEPKKTKKKENEENKEVEESDEKDETKEELTEDLFNLIDSMYDR